MLQVSFFRAWSLIFTGCITLSVASLAAVPVEQRSVGDGFRRSTQDAYQGYQYQAPRQEPALSDPMWELMNQLQALQNEVLELRGLLDQKNYEIQQLQRQQKQHYIDLDQRIQALSGVATPSIQSSLGKSLPNSTSQTVNARASTQQAGSKDEIKITYEEALDLIRKRNYSGAESRLRTLASGPESFYTPFAQYWLAEVLAAKPNPDIAGARAAFEQVIQQYPQHSKVPASLYKLGTILHVQGDTAGGRQVLNRLLSSYPDSSEAGMASRYLDQVVKN